MLLGGMLGGGLAGCFRPMLAADSPSAVLIGRIRLPEFDDRFGFYLNDSLHDRLGRAEAGDFRLEVESRIESRDLAITQDNAVTRISLTATADWALYPTAGSEPTPGAAVLQGRAVSQSGYSSTTSLFATRAAKLDIERRLARDLGERIARSLLARAGGALASAGS
ncbi:MAG: LPS assembly lipoprotein LptE [Alphaproteobacteria bacterium]